MPPKKKKRRTTTNTCMYIHKHTSTQPAVMFILYMYMYDSNRSATVHLAATKKEARRGRIIMSGNAGETAEEPTDEPADATMVAQEPRDATIVPQEPAEDLVSYLICPATMEQLESDETAALADIIGGQTPPAWAQELVEQGNGIVQFIQFTYPALKCFLFIPCLQLLLIANFVMGYTANLKVPGLVKHIIRSCKLGGFQKITLCVCVCVGGGGASLVQCCS